MLQKLWAGHKKYVFLKSLHEIETKIFHQNIMNSTLVFHSALTLDYEIIQLYIFRMV